MLLNLFLDLLLCYSKAKVTSTMFVKVNKSTNLSTKLRVQIGVSD